MTLKYISNYDDENNTLDPNQFITEHIFIDHKTSKISLHSIKSMYEIHKYNLDTTFLFTVPFYNEKDFANFIQNTALDNKFDFFDNLKGYQNSSIDRRVNLVGILGSSKKYTFEDFANLFSNTELILGKYFIEDKIIGYNFTFK